MIAFVWQIKKQFGIIKFGEMTPDHPKRRILHAINAGFFQKRVRERWWGYAHTLIFYAFLIFLLSGIELLIQSLFPAWHLSDLAGIDLASAIHMGETAFAWLTIAALCVLIPRRILRKKAVHNTPEAFVILGLILLIMLSHLGVEVSNIALQYEANWLISCLPICSLLASSLSPETASIVHDVSAGTHIFCISAFLVWIPRGKHAHIIFAFPSLFFQFRSYDSAETPILSPNTPNLEKYAEDLENAIEQDLPEDQWPSPGARHIDDLPPVHRLNALACTQCMRCTNVCPMVAAALDECCGPMQSMLNLRAHLNGQKIDTIPALCSEKELWSCTQCGACDRACPVGTHHTERIIDLRRHLAAQEQSPARIQTALSNLERAGNPWGYARADRKKWTEIIQNPEHPSPTRILIFAGCMSAYDAKARKSLENAVQWLNREGFHVSFLPAETCCGESFRKLGNENEYQSCRDSNLQQIQSIPHDLILTMCPHCAQTLRDDYSDGKTRLNVQHFLTFLADLHHSGRLKISGNTDQKKTVFHYPCRLSKLPDEPKKITSLVRALGLTTLDEDPASAHCCGAGGGQFFLETAREISHLRAQEIAAANPECAASACPFCIQTLRDEFLRSSGAENEVNSLIETVNVVDRCIERSCVQHEPMK